MCPILFNLGPLTIYSYGFFLAFAFFISTTLLARQAKKRGVEPDFIFNLCFICLSAGVIGARLFFIILNFSFFKDNPAEIIMLNHGGLVWYGGLISAVACGSAYVKFKKAALLSILDLLVPYLALAQGIGRIGCFLNGCCYGKLWQAQNILYPTQLISSLVMLFVFLILRILQERDLKKGCLFSLYLILYSGKRFFIEFLRGDSPTVFLNLTVFQLISIGIFLLSSLLLVYQSLKPLRKF